MRPAIGDPVAVYLSTVGAGLLPGQKHILIRVIGEVSPTPADKIPEIDRGCAIRTGKYLHGFFR